MADRQKNNIKNGVISQCKTYDRRVLLPQIASLESGYADK